MGCMCVFNRALGLFPRVIPKENIHHVPAVFDSSSVKNTHAEKGKIVRI